MKRTLLLSIFAAFFAMMFAQYPGGNDPYDRTGGYGNYDDNNDQGHNHRQATKRVQLALILDASGSMNGLINQAKSQFWSILNQLNYSYDGAYPLVEVAIYDYGSKYANARQGYVRQLVPLTTDLDWAADQLYNIRTGGRHEYAGFAIQRATNDLRWDRGYDVDKIIFIAGNERMDQGRTDFRRAVGNAANQGITVHTIFCGDYNDGIRLGWSDAAYTGGGMYTALDHNAYDRHRGYPQDDDLWRLNTRLNATYIPYGARGRDYCERQRRQDRNAYGYGVNFAAQRAMYKASRGYTNAGWDLVDAYRAGTVDLRNISNSDLPQEMQRMSFAQREAYIKQKANERNQIRSRMKQLADVRQQTVQREERVATARPERSANGTMQQAPVRTQSLDQAVRQSVGKKMKTKPVMSASVSSNASSTTRSNTGVTPSSRANTSTGSRTNASTWSNTSTRSSQGTKVGSNSRKPSSSYAQPPSRTQNTPRPSSTRLKTQPTRTTPKRTAPSVRSTPQPTRSSSTVKRPSYTKTAPKPSPKPTPVVRSSTSSQKSRVVKPSSSTTKKVTPRTAPRPSSKRIVIKR